MGFFATTQQQWRYLGADTGVYWNKRGDANWLQAFLYMLTCHGWHIMIMFRFGKMIYAIRIPLLSHVLKIVFQIIWFLQTTFYGIWLDLSCSIGPGFYIGHFGAIILRGHIGSYCSVGQGVTLGSKGAGKSNGWPVLGDQVYIGAGAKIIGAIRIGDRVNVGANAVVISDVPDDSVAVGIPAQIKPKQKIAEDVGAKN